MKVAADDSRTRWVLVEEVQGELADYLKTENPGLPSDKFVECEQIHRFAGSVYAVYEYMDFTLEDILGTGFPINIEVFATEV
jgi:hypothetical protein